MSFQIAGIETYKGSNMYKRVIITLSTNLLFSCPLSIVIDDECAAFLLCFPSTGNVCMSIWLFLHLWNKAYELRSSVRGLMMWTHEYDRQWINKLGRSIKQILSAIGENKHWHKLCRDEPKNMMLGERRQSLDSPGSPVFKTLCLCRGSTPSQVGN